MARVMEFLVFVLAVTINTHINGDTTIADTTVADTTLDDTTLDDTTVADITVGDTTVGGTTAENTPGTTDAVTTGTVPDATTVTEVPVSSDATGTTYEATTYIDYEAAFCRAYLRNHTNWEPYPTYADNGGASVCLLGSLYVLLPVISFMVAIG